MPREIISVHVGQCGNMIGQSFWEECFEEHLLDIANRPPMTGDISGNGVIMDELENGRWMPRAVFADLSPDVIDPIRNGPLSHRFQEDNFIDYKGKTGAGNCWAVGHEEVGLEVRPRVMDTLRQEIEKADSPNCVQLTHSTGGGTGSGFGSLLLQAIKDNYPNILLSAFNVIPPSKGSEIVVEPYNALLTMNEFQEYADMVFMLDNVALGRFAVNRLKIKSPQASDLNVLISHLMSNFSAGVRFPGGYGGDVRALFTNLVFEPRMKFMTSCLLSYKAMDRVFTDVRHTHLREVEMQFQNQWHYQEDDRMTVASYESEQRLDDAIETQSTGSYNSEYNPRDAWGTGGKRERRNRIPSIGSADSRGSKGSRGSRNSRGSDRNIPFSDDGDIPPSLDILAMDADPSDVRRWTPAQVVNWVSTLDNGEYAMYGPKFMAAEVHGTDLASMTKNDLKEDFGISRLVHRKKLYRHIQNLIGREETPRAILIEAPASNRVGGGRPQAYSFDSPPNAYEPVTPPYDPTDRFETASDSGFDFRAPPRQQVQPGHFRASPALSDYGDYESRSAASSPRGGSRHGRNGRSQSHASQTPKFGGSMSNLDPGGMWRAQTPPMHTGSFGPGSDRGGQRPQLWNRYSGGGYNAAYNPHKRTTTLSTLGSLQVRPERPGHRLSADNGQQPNLRRASSGVDQNQLGFGTLRSLLTEVWESQNNFVGVKMKKGRFFSGAALFRGEVNPHEALKELKRLRKQYRERFVNWIPNNISVAMAYRAPAGTSLSTTFLCNHSSIRGVFQRVRKQFRKLYKKRAFMHLYVENGVGEEAFDYADEQLMDLIEYIAEREQMSVDYEEARTEIEEEMDFDTWQSVPIWATIPRRYGGQAVERQAYHGDLPDDLPELDIDDDGNPLYFDPDNVEPDYSEDSESSFGDDDRKRGAFSDSEEVSELRERPDYSDEDDDEDDMDDSNEDSPEKAVEDYEEW